MKIKYDKIKPEYQFTFRNKVEPELKFISYVLKEKHRKMNVTMQQFAKFIGISRSTLSNFVLGNPRNNMMSFHTFNTILKYVKSHTKDDYTHDTIDLPNKEFIDNELKTIPLKELFDIVENTGLTRHYLSRYRMDCSGISLFGACVLFDALKERREKIENKAK